MKHANSKGEFLDLWGEIADLSSAAGVLGWDQETCMPPKGQAGRGKTLATLAGLLHERLTSPVLRDALEAYAEDAAPGSDDAAQVREARRRIERAARIPVELAKRRAEASSRALAAWRAARKEASFALFEKELAEVIAIAREVGEHLAPLTRSNEPFDALLDEHEPGSTAADLAPLFQSLRASLSPIVKAVAESGVRIDDSPARGNFPAEKQRELGLRVAAAMGFDFDAGRLDLAAHPFCSGFHPSDVRLTWRYQTDDFRPALYGIMHEAGHGLYEQGLPAAWERTPLGNAVSLGVHESQSRLWENLVGRSRAFWTWALPHFHAAFPEKRGVTADAIYPALHTVAPTLIRVEADEVTYNLHIVVRFEVERALFGGELDTSDLPGAWDDAYEDLLGIRPPDARSGVLQDIHWSMGAFGYFPTYALGNLINAQLFDAARADLGDLDAMFARGDFAPLLRWLRDRVHRHGSRFEAHELIERATGRPISADAFLAHVRRTTAEVYGAI